MTARHVAHGKSPEQAQLWVARSDERNADLVAAGRELADRRIGWRRELADRRIGWRRELADRRIGWSMEPADRDDAPGRQPHRSDPER
ncbi:MAG TPA: hypothetical protein VFD94_10530 [Jatrophihabitans sp.]|nr:hypothetical protein [Jatrophihabitans sp.]